MDGRVKGYGHSTSCEQPWDQRGLVIACKPCTQTESTLLWQDEVSRGYEHIFLLMSSPTAWGHDSVTMHVNRAYLIHSWSGVMFVKWRQLWHSQNWNILKKKKIKASLTSTPEREGCKHYQKIYFSLFETHNTLSKIKSRCFFFFKNKIKNKRKNLNKTTWAWKKKKLMQKHNKDQLKHLHSGRMDPPWFCRWNRKQLISTSV